ncbi:hypothetical protein CYMTET_39489, partial [Cymbomonas tetramitiformis]
DHFAKKAIDNCVELCSGTEDKTYLDKLDEALGRARTEFSPDLIIYNAGTDILNGDGLGQMKISPLGVQQRDEVVFEFAKAMKAPIVMLTSGGYQKNNAEIIADSISNLASKNLILARNEDSTDA